MLQKQLIMNASTHKDKFGNGEDLQELERAHTEAVQLLQFVRTRARVSITLNSHAHGAGRERSAMQRIVRPCVGSQL